MSVIKMKGSCLAVAAASLILAGCGGSSSDGVSVETLKYTGLTTPAEITEANAVAVGTAVKQVVASLLLGNGLHELADSGMHMVRSVSPYEVANVVKNLAGQQESLQQETIVVAMGGGPVAAEYAYTTTVAGECGGTVVSSFKFKESRTENQSSSVTESGEDISMNYKDLCNYLDDDMERSFVLNGSSKTDITRTVRDQSSGEDSFSSDKRSAKSQSELKAVIDNATYRIKALMQYTYVSESNNTAAYVNKRTEAYAVSGPGVGGVYNYVEECIYNEGCTEYELTKIGNTVYKIEDSYVRDDYVRIEALYLPSYGIVEVYSDDLEACYNPAEGFSEGFVSVLDENDNTITITYDGCGLEPEIEFQSGEPMPD